MLTTTPTIMLVDDNEDFRIIVVEWISTLAITACHEAESYQALRHILATQPDVHADIVLVDLHLPDATGYDVVHYLRQQTAMTNARIVACTADAADHDQYAVQQAGFDGLLDKSIDQTTFLHSLHRLLTGEQVWYDARQTHSFSSNHVVRERVTAKLHIQRATFIATVQRRIPDIVERWTTLDAQMIGVTVGTIQHAVHSLTGSAAILGFGAFSTRLRDLDTCLRSVIDESTTVEAQQETITTLLHQIETMVADLPQAPIQWGHTTTLSEI